MAIFGLAIGHLKNNKLAKFLLLPIIIILFLTFSRSALIGAFVLTLATIFLFFKEKIGACKSAIIIAVISVAVALAGFIAYKSPALQNYFTHDNSSSLRYEQYQRIWDIKAEIGLFGRGSGTAGPSSQSRLDNGENHWTENIYLDIFEELGFIGLFLYLILIGALIFSTYKRGNKSAFLILTAFAVTGIFINYYTGQVGIFLMWLMAALVLNNDKKDINE
jgi:O-antigen ligase